MMADDPATQNTAPLTISSFNDVPAMNSPEGPKPWGRLVPIGSSRPMVELMEDTYMMGRTRKCPDNLRFDDPQISSLHCTLTRKDDGGNWVAFVHDSSTNGTFINGRRIGKGNQTALNNGDTLTLGPGKFFQYLFSSQQAVEMADREEAESIGQFYDLRSNVLGKGNFAEVRLAFDKRTTQRVAVKIIDKKKFALQPNLRKDSIRDEIQVLQNIQHPNIISILNQFETAKNVYIVLEFAEGGELFERIVSKATGFSEDRAREIFRQLLDALAYLHAGGIVHRDLKPENILLANKEEDSPIKLTDFGLSRIIGIDQLMSTLCGTPQYLAPEVLVAQQHPGTGYGREVDLWSAGVILYILLCGYPPFYEDGRKKAIYQQIQEGFYDFPSKPWSTLNPDAIKLVRRLLTVDPLQRATIQDCLNHPWMTYGQTESPLVLSLRDGEGPGLQPSKTYLGSLSSLSSEADASNSNTMASRKREHSDDGDDSAAKRQRRA